MLKLRKKWRGKRNPITNRNQQKKKPFEERKEKVDD